MGYQAFYDAGYNAGVSRARELVESKDTQIKIRDDRIAMLDRFTELQGEEIRSLKARIEELEKERYESRQSKPGSQFVSDIKLVALWKKMMERKATDLLLDEIQDFALAEHRIREHNKRIPQGSITVETSRKDGRHGS